MALPALCLAYLFSVVTATPHSFYYHTGYRHQPTYQVAYQPPLISPYFTPLPLAAAAAAAAAGFHQSYIPAPAALPTYPIYSQRARVGYSYETQDSTGSHSQVLYIAGPNSPQLFQQNVRDLHFPLPTVYISSPAPSNGTTEATQPAPQLTYFHAQVLPPQVPGGSPLPTLPLFTYSFQTNGGGQKTNESETSEHNSSLKPDDSASQTEETDTGNENSESLSTPTPISEDFDSSSSSEDEPESAPEKGKEENATDSPDTATDSSSSSEDEPESAPEKEKEENATDSPDTATETTKSQTESQR